MKLKLNRASIAVVHLTRQQMLENMVTHYIIEGNGPALDASNKCHYFMPATASEPIAKCGIGCQFDDDLAARVQRAFSGGTSVSHLVTGDLNSRPDSQVAVMREVRNQIKGSDAEFAQTLQSIHDNSARENTVAGEKVDLPSFRNVLFNRLAALAKENKLELRPASQS